MTDSEMRAIVQASFMMLQKLIVEVAATKGDESSAWIDAFHDDLTSEMKKVEELQKHRADTERAATSRMLIEGVPFLRGPARQFAKRHQDRGSSLIQSASLIEEERRCSSSRFAINATGMRAAGVRWILAVASAVVAPEAPGMASLKLL